MSFSVVFNPFTGNLDFINSTTASGALLAVNNLSDVANRITSLTNLGIPNGDQVVSVGSGDVTLTNPLPGWTIVGNANGVNKLILPDSNATNATPDGINVFVYNSSSDFYQPIYDNGGITLITSLPPLAFGYVIKLSVGGGGWSIIPISLADVVGPSSSSDNAIARYDGTTGKLIQDSSAFVDDDGLVFSKKGIQIGQCPIQAGSTVVSVVVGVSAVLSLPAVYTMPAVDGGAGVSTGPFINVNNSNTARTVLVGTTAGSTTITGNFIASDVGAQVYGSNPVLTTTLGTTGTSMSLQGVESTTGVGAAQMQLIADTNIDPRNRIQAQILLYGKTGRNYERYTYTIFDRSASVAASYNGLGRPMSIVLQAGGSAGQAIASGNAIKITKDASTEIAGGGFTVGVQNLDVPTALPKNTAVRGITDGISAILSTEALATGTYTVLYQPYRGAPAVITGVGLTSGSRTATGAFVGTNSLGYVAQAEVNAGGTGYTVGDYLIPTAGDSTAKVKVKEVSGTGAVTVVNIDEDYVGSTSSGYVGATNVATTGGTGTGATLDIGVQAGSVWAIPTISRVITTTLTVTDAVTTVDSTTLTSVSSSFVANDQYRSVIGDGIPEGTFISTVNSGTNITLSKAATRTASGVAMTFGPAWVLNAAVGTAAGWTLGSSGRIDSTIVGSPGTDLKEDTIVAAGTVSILPKVGATGDQLPVAGDVGLPVYSTKAFTASDVQITDPYNTGKSILIMNTMTGNGGTSVVSDKTYTDYRRGGTSKWRTGLNPSFANIDSYDITLGDTTPVVMLTTAGGARMSNFLRVGNATADPLNTTAGDITGLRLSVGNLVLGDSNGQFVSIKGTMTNTASGATSFMNVQASITPTANSASEFRSFNYQNIINPATTITVATVTGLYLENRLRSDSVVTTITGIKSNAVVVDSSSAATVLATNVFAYDAIGFTRPSGTSAATITTLIGYNTSNLGATGLTATNVKHINIGNASATAITNQVGVDIAALTTGSTLNIGVRIAAPSGATSNYAIQLSDTGGTLAGGITWGTGTSNLYRSAANTLTTDGSLAIVGTLTAGTYTGQTSIVTLGTITTGVWNGTAINHAYLTGIVQADVGGLTTASTPTFAGINLGTSAISTVGNIAVDSTAVRDITVARHASAAGSNFTIQAGGAVSAGSNLAGGDLVLSTGVSTGSARANIKFNVSHSGAAATTDNTLDTQAIFFAPGSGFGILSIGNVGGSSTGLPTNLTNNTFAFSGNSVGGIGAYRHTTSNTAGSVMTVQAAGATSGATNKSGGTLTLSGGISTGSGTGQVAIKVFPGTAASTTDNTAITAINFNGSGLASTYANVTTAGWGIPAIYSAGRSTAQNAAVASVATYTVGAADGTFVVSANVLVTTATAHSFNVTCAYTDEGNTTRTLTLNFATLAGVISNTAIGNLGGAVPYEGVPMHIRCKASTAITIATTGTFTTVTYNVEGIITQVA